MPHLEVIYHPGAKKKKITLRSVTINLPQDVLAEDEREAKSHSNLICLFLCF